MNGPKGVHPKDIELAVAIVRGFARVQGKTPPQVDQIGQDVRDDLTRRDVNPGGQVIPNPRPRP